MGSSPENQGILLSIHINEYISSLKDFLHLLSVKSLTVIYSKQFRHIQCHNEISKSLEKEFDIFTPIQIEELTEETHKKIENSLKTLPEAIVALDDILGIHTLKALKSLDVDVPEKVKVIGFDNIPFSSLCTPTLTTFSLPIQEMINKAFEIVTDNISGRHVFRFKPTLVVREST